MRQTLAIFFLSAHLLGNTEFGQFFRLPQLFSHYRQHCQDRPIHFLTFIAMHYGGDDGTTADDQEDTRLPCQNTQGDHSYLHALTKISHPVPDQTAPKHGITLLPTYYVLPGLLPGYKGRILQPPRA